MNRTILLALVLAATAAFATEPRVVPASELTWKWKRTKSIAAPVEKLRKGLEVEVDGTAPRGVEVKVDADTGEILRDIQFRLESAELIGATTFAQLAEIAKAMPAAGTERFLMEGDTCDLGSDAHNLTLSQRRALAGRAALTAQGVPAERRQVIGFGESDPSVKNTDEPARAQNRRVQTFRKL